MPTPSTSLLINSTNPPAPDGFQNAKPLSEGAGTPLVSVSFNVPNTGGVSVQTADYTAQDTDCGMLLVFDSATAVTLTLPAIPFSQWNITAANIGAGDLTISPSSLLLDGSSSSLTAKQFQNIAIATDGANYFSARSGLTSLPLIAMPDLPVNVKLSTVGLIIDGGGGQPTNGAKGFVQCNFPGTITRWTLLADISGSAQITVMKGTYAAYPTVTSIVASAPPNLSSAQKNTSTTLTGWTTAVSAGDVFAFNLDSVSTNITRLTLELQITRS